MATGILRAFASTPGARRPDVVQPIPKNLSGGGQRPSRRQYFSRRSFERRRGGGRVGMISFSHKVSAPSHPRHQASSLGADSLEASFLQLVLVQGRKAFFSVLCFHVPPSSPLPRCHAAGAVSSPISSRQASRPEPGRPNGIYYTAAPRHLLALTCHQAARYYSKKVSNYSKSVTVAG